VLLTPGGILASALLSRGRSQGPSSGRRCRGCRRVAVLIPQRGEQVGYAVDVVIGDQALPGGTAALLVAPDFVQGGDAGQRQQGGEPAAIAHEDVCVQPISHHDGTSRIDVELAHHAIEHVPAGLSDDEGLALGCRLHCFYQAAGP